MEYTVRNKTFKIDFVSNYVHEKYTELVALVFELSDNTKIDEAYELLKSKVKDDNEKAKSILKDVDIKRKKYVKDITEIRREIIKELIESNGIDYDFTWWSKRTSPDDINSFMLSCIKQDLQDSKPTKKK